ncbi:MAG: hypothetical protein ICV83_08440 [Cytophagales bacterium]|nr:hypothetical protein [Cytophagales bacterium]
MQDTALNASFLETYSHTFARQTANAFFEQQTHISGKEITAFTAIMQVNLLVLDNLFGSWQHEMARLRSPYFDYESPEVAQVLEQFMNILSRHIKVDRQHFEPLVAAAAARSLRLVLTPRDFFTGLFGEVASGAVPLEALRSRLKFFQWNKFLLQETVARLENGGAAEVSPENLAATFDAVFTDRQGDLEKPEAVVELFARHVPLKLDDLKAAPPKPQPAQQQSFWVDIEQFAAAANQPQQLVAPATTPVVDTGTTITPVAPPEQTPPQVAPIPPAHPMPINPEPVNPEPINPEPVNPVPVNPEPIHPVPVNPEPVKTPPVPAELNQRFSESKETLNDRFRAQSSDSLAERHRKQRIDNLRNAISLNQRFLFVKGLFRGDSNAFLQALTDLEGCADYNAAVQLLKTKYGTTYGWSPDSEEFQDFMDLIQRKF